MAFDADDWLGLIVWQALSWAAAGIGVGYMREKDWRAWYDSLRKPCLAPPRWIFHAVWTLLYPLIGTAAFLVWQRQSQALPPGVYHAGLALHIVQMALNAVWTPLFFGGRMRLLSLIVLMVMIAISIIVVALFAVVFWLSGVFYGIYLLWLCIALQLNLLFVNPPEDAIRRRHQQQHQQPHDQPWLPARK